MSQNAGIMVCPIKPLRGRIRNAQLMEGGWKKAQSRSLIDVSKIIVNQAQMPFIQDSIDARLMQLHSSHTTVGVESFVNFLFEDHIS